MTEAGSEGVCCGKSFYTRSLHACSDGGKRGNNNMPCILHTMHLSIQHATAPASNVDSVLISSDFIPVSSLFPPLQSS